MNRVLESEVMNDPEQALAYAQADFSEENQYFIGEFRQQFPEFERTDEVDGEPVDETDILPVDSTVDSVQ